MLELVLRKPTKKGNNIWRGIWQEDDHDNNELISIVVTLWTLEVYANAEIYSSRDL